MLPVVGGDDGHSLQGAGPLVLPVLGGDDGHSLHGAGPLVLPVVGGDDGHSVQGAGPLVLPVVSVVGGCSVVVLVCVQKIAPNYSFVLVIVLPTNLLVFRK